MTTERQQWEAVMDRLVTDEMLRDLTNVRGMDLPLSVLRRRLRFVDYDYDRLKQEMAFSVIDWHDEVSWQDNFGNSARAVRTHYSVVWPDGTKWTGVDDQQLSDERVHQANGGRL